MTRKVLTYVWQHSMVAVLCAAMAVLPACSLQSVLSEGEKILSYLPMAANIALPLVCIDAPVCPAATAAVKVFDAAQAAVLTLFQAWQSAATAAQPAILSQLQAALVTLQQQYQNLLAALHVVNANIVGEVGAILAAMMAAITSFAQLVGVTLATGGTAAAARKVLRAGMLKSGPLAYSSSDFKKAIVSAVNKKTGDATLDPLNSALASQAKAW